MIKELLFLSFLLVALAVPVVRDSLDEHWDLYKASYNKTYSSQQEELVRRSIWKKNVDYIAKHNREYDLGIHTYTVGLNNYADMTSTEFVSTMCGNLRNSTKLEKPTATIIEPSNTVIPDSVDWREHGYVTPVQNQGACGSSWAYAAIGSLEGQHYKTTKQLIQLSVQNLLDCSRDEGNNGCEGGWMDWGFMYIKKNNGIDTEKSYPYIAKNDDCNFKRSGVGATVKGYADIKKSDENALKSAVATIGPIAVAIDAYPASFMLYKGRVYDNSACSSTPNHGALIVGYGVTNSGKDYWIVKNQWGTNWGLKGYVLMSRNKNNQCGIATVASYPIV